MFSKQFQAISAQSSNLFKRSSRRFKALLGESQLKELELERLMAATREYSQMRARGKFGGGKEKGAVHLRFFKIL